MNQHRITTAGPLLDDRGGLVQAGFATEPLLAYRRDRVQAPPWRLKEWDYYQVSNDEYCAQFTIGHAAYAGQVGVTFFRFADGWRVDRAVTLPLPFGSLHMPETSAQGLTIHRGGVTIGFRVVPGASGELRRMLRCATKPTKTTPAIRAEITLTDAAGQSVVMATPFHKHPEAFYYNHKINGMPASGSIQIGADIFAFEPRTAFGLLDWGRGVWPFSTEWFWGSGSTWVDGVPFGWNIGRGFGDTSAATENMLFYDGVAHKLSQVSFDENSPGYLDPKHFSSDDGRFEMDFVPLYDRVTRTKLAFVDNECHQVFGRFTGTAILDDGREIHIRDVMAFAEHAVNNW